MNNNIIKSLSKQNFKSSTKSLNINLTAWSGIQSDYILYKNIKTSKPQILYTTNSDHLPIIIDIRDNKINLNRGKTLKKK